MASGPITSWQIDCKKMETVTNLIFFGSKITADGDCSHEIERCLFFGRKAITNLDSILKSKDIADKNEAKGHENIDARKIMNKCKTCEVFRGSINGDPLQFSCLENPMAGGAW